MKKLTVTLVLMLALNLSMAAAVVEKPTPVGKTDTKAIPSFHNRNDGIALFNNKPSPPKQVVTNDRLYPLLVTLSPDAADIFQSMEYLRWSDVWTAASQMFNALLTEAGENDWRSSFVWPTKTNKQSYL